MALLNIVPFDLNRRPGRPSKIGEQKGTPKTSATAAVHKTPEQRPTVNEGKVVERRRVERRNRYKPMDKDRRASMRRNLDLRKSKTQPPQQKSASQSIDIKV